MPRIIAGEFGGRRLEVASGATRPTSDRVRESVFGVLDARIDLADMTVLDLFAGTGALGLEALSRGAARAVFVDADRSAVRGLTANITRCGADRRSTVVRSDVTAYLGNAAGEAFDMVFCDPPYDLPDEELTGVLHLVAPLLRDGYLVLERAKRCAPTTWPTAVEPVFHKVYGDTRVEWAQVCR